MEILHIARTDLNQIGIFRHDLDIVLIDNLSDDAQPRLISDIAENFESLKPEALEIIRTRTWLERAAAQELCTGFLDLYRNIVDLLIALHRAGPRHDRQLFPSDGEARHVHNTVRRMKVSADQFILLCNTNCFLNTIHHVHLKPRNELLISNHTDDKSILALGEMCAKPCLFNFRRDLVNIRLCGSRIHNNNHNAPPSYLNHSDFITVRIFRTVDALFPNLLWKFLAADTDKAEFAKKFRLVGERKYLLDAESLSLHEQIADNLSPDPLPRMIGCDRHHTHLGKPIPHDVQGADTDNSPVILCNNHVTQILIKGIA